MFRSHAASVAVLCALLGLGGCATTVQHPAHFKGSQVQAGLTYAQGVDYVEDARGKVEKQLADLDTLGQATRAGVGVGFAGAAIGGIFRAHIHPVLGLLTLGGLSYQANQAMDPQTVGSIYSAALTNFDCIGEAGEQAFHGKVAERISLPAHAARISALIGNLNGDIASAAGNKKYDGKVAEATEVLATAGQALIQINQRIAEIQVADDDIAKAMVRSTDRTLVAMNQELRARQPSLEAIAKAAGDIYPATLNSGAAVRADAASAAANITRQAAGHADPLNAAFVQHQNALKAELEAVAKIASPPIDVTAIGACHVQFVAASPLALRDGASIDLDAGATVPLTTASGAAGFPQWVGPAPKDVTVNALLTGATLTAQATAAEKSYRFRLVDSNQRYSDVYVLNVHAAPAAQPAAPAAPAAKPAANPSGPPPPPKND